MGYPLPDDLQSRIRKAIAGVGVFPEETQNKLVDAIGILLVRENRRARKGVAKMRREFITAAEIAEEQELDPVPGYVGEEACNHIINNILKQNVYYNTEESDARKAAVEKTIEAFFKDGPAT